MSVRSLFRFSEMSSKGSKLKSIVIVTLIAVLYLAAIAAVLVVGDSIELEMIDQIIIVAVILLTLPILVLIIHFFRKRKAAGTDQSAQTQPANATANSGLDADINNIKQWLQGTKIGTGQGSAQVSDVLYRLPWYIVAGPPQSGKSTLLTYGGLEFHALPGQRHADLYQTTPTQDHTWRVTDQAILLDTAGRFQSESGQGDWASMMSALASHRRQRPVDGLVLTISLAQLLSMREPQIDEQCRLLRARLDETADRFGMKIPIYLVFTNCDALPGFEEFFSSLDQRERTGCWGTSVPMEQFSAGSSNSGQTSNPQAFIDDGLASIGEALFTRRLNHLRPSMSPEEQLQTFAFPMRFAHARNRVSLFLAALLRPNPYRDLPLVRGIYFSSNLQQKNAVVRAGRASGYFTEGVFKQILEGDGGIAAALNAGNRRPRNKGLILTGVAAACIFAFVFSLGMVWSFFNNRELVLEVGERGAELAKINAETRDAETNKQTQSDISREIQTADNFRIVLERLDRYDNGFWNLGRPLTYRFGLYSGSYISQYARAVYFEFLNRRLFIPAVRAVKDELQNSTPNLGSGTVNTATKSQESKTQTINSNNSLDRYYDLLIAYLMLTDAQKAEPAFLNNVLPQYWERSVPTPLQTDARRELEFYAVQAKYDDAPHIAIDNGIESMAWKRLDQYPAVNRIYRSLTNSIDSQGNAITVDQILQKENRGRGQITSSYAVPYSFTIKGYSEYLKRVDSFKKTLNQEGWKLGPKAEDRDRSSIIGDLKDKYFNDYVLHWQTFLRGVSIKQFENREQAIQSLRELSTSPSSLQLVLDVVVKNTRLNSGANGFWSFLGSSEDVQGAKKVENEFLPLSNFFSTKGSQEKESRFNNYQTDLKTLYSNLKSKTDSDESFNLVKKDALAGKDDIDLKKIDEDITALVGTFRTGPTNDAALLLKQPVENLRTMLTGSGYELVARTWETQVRPFAQQRLEGRFPFAASESEVLVSDLSQYLNPVNGIFTNYFDSQLKSFFEDSGGHWVVKDKYRDKFSQEFIAYLNNARALRDALFPSDSKDLKVRYGITIDPVAGADVTLRIDGVTLHSMGNAPDSKNLEWPAPPSGETGARISVIPANGSSQDKPFTGSWGLFQLVAAGMHSKSGDKYILQWRVGVPVTAKLSPSSLVNPFDMALFTRLKAPQKLKD